MTDPTAPRGPHRDDDPLDPLGLLEAHGFAVSALSEEQREVLRDLSPAELDLLLDIKDRLDEVGPEVQAHSEIAGGALF